MGMHLNWDRVLEIAGEAAPGRPHVAEALVEAGHVANSRDAFARYLGNDGPAYAEVHSSRLYRLGRSSTCFLETARI
jgi:predicted metal-dependent phosphoesterase TrpH